MARRCALSTAGSKRSYEAGFRGPGGIDRRSARTQSRLTIVCQQVMVPAVRQGREIFSARPVVNGAHRFRLNALVSFVNSDSQHCIDRFSPCD